MKYPGCVSASCFQRKNLQDLSKLFHQAAKEESLVDPTKVDEILQPRNAVSLYTLQPNHAEENAMCSSHNHSWPTFTKLSMFSKKPLVSLNQVPGSSIRARYLVHTWRFFFIFLSEIRIRLCECALLMIYRVKLGRCISFAFLTRE